MSTTPTNLGATEFPESHAGQSVPGVARMVWLAGLGFLALTGKGATSLFQYLVEEGKEFEPELDASLQEMWKKMERLLPARWRRS